MRKFISSIAASLMIISLCSCTDSQKPVEQESDKVVISFEYEKQSGHASNQFAVWVEDLDGNLVKTLYVTNYTAKGGYVDRPDAIPLWVEKSGLKTMEKSHIDAITSATPDTGTLSYTWDLKDEDGNPVLPGKYTFFVEGNLRWKNRILCSGVIPVNEDQVSVEAQANFLYEDSNEQEALTKDSPENSMIGSVTASFVPASKTGA